MYTVDQWTGLSVNDCMEAIKQMVVLPANVAADKEAFYNMKQGPQESISAYFSRAYTTVANCGFKCPSCHYGLENYLLLSKVAVGLGNNALKKEVYRSFEWFKNINDLRSFCVAYETAMQSSTRYQDMAYADRLTGWVEMAHLPNDTTSNRLKDIFRLYFSRWGAPEELSTDGGTNLVSDEMTSFFKHWGVNMRISSAYYPQSNGRAEAAVKTAKRLLRDNVGANGSLNTDRMSIALLQYRNTPLRGSNRSPAQLIAGRQLRDGVPAVREHYKIQQGWYQDIDDRKTAVAEAHEKILAG